MAFNDLSPGLYVSNGKNTKSITDGDVWRSMFSSSNGRDASETTIAATVAWVYAALSFRQEVLGQIEYKWQLGDEDIEETDLPFAFDTMGYIKRADKAIQMCGNAYLYKQTNAERRRNGEVVRGGRVVGLRWLDPRQVTPDESSLKNYIDGYTIYRYNADKEPNKPLPSDKIIRTFIQGLNELDPDGAAAKAYNLAAQIIWGMDSVGNAFYDTNALPLMMISVPDSASQDEINNAQTSFKRIFQRLRDGRGNKVAAMRQGTTVTPLSFAPKDLAQDTLREAEILSILAAMEVPAALMYRDVNRAEAEEKYRQFVGVMGSRFNMMAQALNSDPLFKANNLTLNVMVNEHPSMQRDEEKAAITALRFVEVGMTPAAALYKVGIDLSDFPKEIEVLRDEEIVIDTPSPAAIPEMEPEDSGIGADEVKAKLDKVDAMLETLSESIKAMTTPQPLTAGVEDAPDERQAEIKALQNFIKKGTHRKRPFASSVLSHLEIKAEITEQDERDAEELADRLQELIEQAARGEIPADEFREEYLAVFLLALTAAAESGAEGAMIEQGAAKLAEMEAQAAESVDKLSAEIYAGRYSEGGINPLTPDAAPYSDTSEGQSADTAVRKVVNRVALWAGSLALAFSVGQVNSEANADIKYMWQVGPTDHCADCLRLNNQVHTAEEWAASGIEPQSPDLLCKGYNCQCRLVEVAPDVPASGSF